MRTTSLRSIVDLVVTIMLGTAAVAVVWRTVVPSTAAGGSGGTRREAVESVTASKLTTSIADSNIKGSAKASVVLIEFGDFECPFCEKHSQEVFNLIDRNFVATGRLRYAFRHFPLENVHPNAFAAAEAAECAGRQGKFWEMYSLLFAKRNDLSQRFWQNDAESIGLEPAVFTACLNGAALQKVRDEIAEGRRLGIDSTPTFLIGVAQPDGTVSIATKVRGAKPYEVFEKAIEEILAGPDG